MTQYSSQNGDHNFAFSDVYGGHKLPEYSILNQVWDNATYPRPLYNVTCPGHRLVIFHDVAKPSSATLLHVARAAATFRVVQHARHRARNAGRCGAEFPSSGLGGWLYHNLDLSRGLGLAGARAISIGRATPA